MLKRALFLFTVFLALSTLAPGCARGEAGVPGTGFRIGCLAPDFNLAGLDGQRVSLGSLRGRAVVLNFWEIN